MASLSRRDLAADVYKVCVVGDEAEDKDACGTEKLCGGMEARIEGGIHSLRILWQHHFQEEDWVFFLIDACNAFNEENCTSMLWAVCHKCPSGAQFTFSCYCHWDILMIRAGNGAGHFLYIKGG